MVFFLLLLLLIIFNGLQFSRAGEFNEHYLDKETTTAINGIFVILVVFSHYAGYANFEGVYDAPYLALRTHLNQMVVASFLFYSGYGMMESIKKKGSAYTNKIVTKFWQLLLRFDIAVLLYLLLDILLGIKYPVKHILLAFTSWTNVGNSNWYITAILMIYVCMFLSFKICYKLFLSKRNEAATVLTIILTVACIYLQIKVGRPPYCYNTMLLAPLGMIFSLWRNRIERVVEKSDICYSGILTIIGGVYIVSFFHRWDYGLGGYTVWAIAFTLILVLVTMKVYIHNNLLEFFGKHVFSIYILQRIPMMLLDHFGCIESHKYISLVAVFLVIIPLALIFEKGTDAIIALIGAPKEKK